MGRFSARTPAAVAFGVLFFLGAGAPTRADNDVLHEYVPNVQADEADRSVSGRSPARLFPVQPMPPARDGAMAEQPQLMTALPGDGRLGEEPGARSAQFRPDRVTAFAAETTYDACFSPSIAPFKRVTALGLVSLASDGKTPVLRISDMARRELNVEGTQTDPPDLRPRDRFWGDVMLEFENGAVLPLPSISPESRILALDTRPPIELRIEKDGDDNFYAVATGPVRAARVRLRFLTDAPRSYFGTFIPRLSSDVLQNEIAPLHPSIQQRAEAFAAELGLRRGGDLRKAIRTLTRHFRSFQESSSPPQNTGDIYLDLARGLKGVCRHRAYAFVITAQALGLPARFVQNEAHAWVEVKLPGPGWMRIDLGGAAHGLRALSLGQRPLYRTANPDELPRPSAFEQSRAQAERAAADPSRGPAADSPPASAARLRAIQHLVGRWVLPDPRGPSLLEPPAGVADGLQREKLRLSVDQRRVTVHRGRSLPLSGRVVDSGGNGVPDLIIEALLAAPNRSANLVLGVTQSDRRGYFRATFQVPVDVPVGDYQLVVLTRGNDRYLPAEAR